MPSHLRASGPFDDHINGALEACFGQGLGGIQADFGSNSFNQSINAIASTAGSAMSFGSGLGQDASDPFAMEVIGHEVAHALAGGGSGKSSIDQPGDPGEDRADAAGKQFAAFMTGGGPAPSLSPAHGGQAAIHRFEGAEHKDAVDGAGDRMLLLAYQQGTLNAAQRKEVENRLKNEAALTQELTQIQGTDASQLPQVQEVDNEVLDMMNKPVTLKNGEVLTPGEITAMMGDFFGVFEADGTLNPVASFEQLSDANPEEIRALRSALEREKKGEKIETGEWQEIGKLKKAKDYNGDGKLDNIAYLDLAARNDAHFSGPGMREKNPNDNMSAYTALHAAALEAAERGDMETARAMEASSMHYLTDRHAGGHAFEKKGVLDAAGQNTTPTGTLPILMGIGLHGGVDAPTSKDQMDALSHWAFGENVVQNGASKVVHDHYNENGVDVTNTKGEAWKAFGDGNWAEEKNTANRAHAADSVYSSYNELRDVGAKKTTAAAVSKDYAAHKSVGQFSAATQADAEARARNVSPTEAIKALWAEDGAGVLKIKGEEALDEGVDWAKENIPLGSPLAPTYDELTRGLSWAGDQAEDLGDAASDTWNDASSWVASGVGNWL